MFARLGTVLVGDGPGVLLARATDQAVGAVDVFTDSLVNIRDVCTAGASTRANMGGLFDMHYRACNSGREGEIIANSCPPAPTDCEIDAKHRHSG